MPNEDQPPRSDRLLLQLIRLARAQFDMRSAEALSHELEKTHDHISPWAYGLYTGLAVSYARSFEAGKENPYGPLDPKWGKFPNRPDLRKRHLMLLNHRNKLLAHNDLTPHRVVFAWPDFNEGRPAVVEARSPINADGVRDSRELFKFQELRFAEHVQLLAERLQTTLGWGKGEIDLDAELARLRATEQEPRSSEDD